MWFIPNGRYVVVELPDRPTAWMSEEPGRVDTDESRSGLPALGLVTMVY